MLQGRLRRAFRGVHAAVCVGYIVGDDLHIRANGGGLTCTVAAGKVDDVKVEINGALSVNCCGLQA
jgi:hypothetical protein